MKGFIKCDPISVKDGTALLNSYKDWLEITVNHEGTVKYLINKIKYYKKWLRNHKK